MKCNSSVVQESMWWASDLCGEWTEDHGQDSWQLSSVGVDTNIVEI